MTAIPTQAATAIAALLAVLCLIWITARILRCLRPGTLPDGNQTLRIGGVLALDSHRRIYLITCEDRRVLLLAGGTTDVVIGWLPPSDTGEGGQP